MKKMKFLAMVAGVLVTVSLVSFKVSKDTAPSNTKAMIADWKRAKAYTLEYLSAANEEVIAYKPTPDMRSFGQQMLHMAEANYGFGSTASGKASPITFGQLEKAASDYKTVEALTKAVADSYDFVIAALEGFDESKMDETIRMFNRFDLTRGEGFNKAFEHQTHHRAQTTVYLRLKGIKPPNEKLF